MFLLKKTVNQHLRMTSEGSFNWRLE